MKTCPDCRETKPETDFYRSTACCRPCKLARKRAWCAANPVRVRANVARQEATRSAKLAGATVVDRCPQVAAIYEAAAWLRSLGDDVHVDHVVPITLGGTHTHDNLRILPAATNLSKGSNVPADLGDWQRFQREWAGLLQSLPETPQPAASLGSRPI